MRWSDKIVNAIEISLRNIVTCFANWKQKFYSF